MPGEITQKLFKEAADEIYAYRETPFTLASGKMSHHYFNCKKITLHPERLSLLARAIRDELIPTLDREKGQDFEAVGGLTLGADPIAYALSLAYQQNQKVVFPLIVRKQTKDHGTGKKIEGEVDRVRKVLLLDDVITTAGSSLKAVEAFREAGLIVTDAVCIVDREEGGKENLEKASVRLHSLFRKTDFMQA